MMMEASFNEEDEGTHLPNQDQTSAIPLQNIGASGRKIDQFSNASSESPFNQITHEQDEEMMETYSLTSGIQLKVKPLRSNQRQQQSVSSSNSFFSPEETHDSIAYSSTPDIYTRNFEEMSVLMLENENDIHAEKVNFVSPLDQSRYKTLNATKANKFTENNDSMLELPNNFESLSIHEMNPEKDLEEEMERTLKTETPWWMKERVSKLISTSSAAFDTNNNNLSSSAKGPEFNLLALDLFSSSETKNSTHQNKNSNEENEEEVSPNKIIYDYDFILDTKSKEIIDKGDENDRSEQEDQFVGGIGANYSKSKVLPDHYRHILFPETITSSERYKNKFGEEKSKDDFDDNFDDVSLEDQYYSKIQHSIDDRVHTSAVHAILHKHSKPNSEYDDEHNDNSWIWNNPSYSIKRQWCHLDYSTLEESDLAELNSMEEEEPDIEKEFIDIEDFDDYDDGLKDNNRKLISVNSRDQASSDMVEQIQDEIINQSSKESKDFRSKIYSSTQKQTLTHVGIGTIDVLNFRKGIELCLASFATVFHVLEANSTHKKSKLTNFMQETKHAGGEEKEEYMTKVNKTKSHAGDDDEYSNVSKFPFVPLQIVLRLWAQVLLPHLRRSKESNSYNGASASPELSTTESSRFSVTDKNYTLSEIREAESMAYHIATSLLSSAVQMFQVRQTGGKRMQMDLEEDLHEQEEMPAQENDNVDATPNVEEKIEPQNADNAGGNDNIFFNEEEDEIEIRFYGEAQLHYAWNHHPVLNARFSSAGNLNTEEMVLLMDNLGNAKLSEEEQEARDWISIFCKQVLRKILFLEKNGADEIDSIREKDNRDAVEKATLPHLYAIRYYPTFLLRIGLFRPPQTLFASISFLEKKIQVDPDIQGACFIMKDTSFITRRMELLGLLEGSMVHLDDAQFLIETAKTKNNVNLEMHHSDVKKKKKKVEVFSEFIKIHQAISSSLQTYLTNRNIQSEKMKIPMQNLYNHNANEIAKWEENQSLQKMTSNYEAGKALHALGVSLGRYQMTIPFVSYDLDFAIEVEMSMYPKSIHRYKEALRLLTSNKLGQTLVPPPPPGLNHDRMKLYHATFSAQAKIVKQRMIKEIELSVADTLSCLSYCKDAKVGHYDEAFRTYEEALGLYKNHFEDSDPTISHTLHNIGSICVELERYIEAITYYQECVSVTKKRKDKQPDTYRRKGEDEELSNTLQSIGNVHKLLLDNPSALKCYLEAYSLIIDIREAKNKLTIAVLLTQITDIYMYEIYRDRRALPKVEMKTIEYLNESLRIRKLHTERETAKNNVHILNIKSEIAQNLYSLGCIHFFKEEYDDALLCLKDAIEIRKGIMKTDIDERTIDLENLCKKQNDFIALKLYLIGKIHLSERDFSLASKSFEELSIINKEQLLKCSTNDEGSRATFQLFSAIIGLAVTLMHRGSISFMRKECKNAKEIFKESLRILDGASLKCSQVIETDDNRSRLKDIEKSISSTTASLYHLLGKTYVYEEKYERARKCFEDVVKIRKALNQNQHIEVGNSLQEIGFMYLTTDKHNEAISCLQKAVMIKETVLTEGINFQDDPFFTYDKSEVEDNFMKCCIKLFEMPDSLSKLEGQERILAEEMESTDLRNKDINNAASRDLLSKGELAVKIGKVFLKNNDIHKALNYFAEASTPLQQKFGRFNLELGKYNFEKGKAYMSLLKYNEAVECFEESIQILREIKRNESISFAEILHYLGDMYLKIDKYQDALQSYKEAFSLRTRILGDAHIDTGDSLHQIGIISLEWKNDLNIAYQCIITALKIRKSKLDPDHLAIAESLHHLGKIHHMRNELQMSKIVLLEELNMRRRIDIDHKDHEKIEKIGDCLLSVGELFFSQKDMGKAEQYFDEALQLYCTIFGKEHLSSLKCMNNIGGLFYETGRFEEAVDCFQRVLHVSLPCIERNHIELAYTHFHFGLVYAKLDKNDDAMESFIKSLGIYKHHFGKENAFVIDCMNNMGIIFFNAEYYDKALKCFGQALHSCNNIFGANHEKTGELSKKMGEVMVKMSNFDAALDHYHDAASVMEMSLRSKSGSKEEMRQELLCVLNEIARITKERFGKENEEMANVLSHIGNLHAEKKEFEIAMNHFTEVLRIHKLILGHDDIALSTDLHNIGSIYYETKENKKAIKYFEECVRITKLKLGSDSHVLTETLRCIANAERREGNFDTAADFFKEAVRVYRLYIHSTGLNDDVKVAKLMHNLGSVHDQIGNYDYALRLFEEVLQIGKKNLSSDNIEIANILCSIANVYRNRIEYDKAMECYEKAMHIHKLNKNKDTLLTAKLLHSIAQVYDAKGDSERAIRCYEDALYAYTRMLGPDDIDMAKVLGDLGSVLDTLGHREKAIRYFESSLAILVKKLGNDDTSVADALLSIGVAFDKNGHYKRAMDNYDESLRIYNLKLSKDHLKTAKPLHNIGIIQAKQGKYAQSIGSLREAIRIKVLRLGERHVDVAESQYYYGNVFRERNETKEALKELTRSFQIRATIFGRDHLVVADTLFCIGLTHLQQKDFQSALQCLVECLRVRRLLMSSTAIKIAEVQLHIGKVLHEIGNLFESEICLRDALPIMILQYGNKHIKIAELFTVLGIVLSDQRKFSSAIELYEEALEITLDCKGYKTIDTANIIENIAIALKESNSYTDATKGFQEVLALKQEILGENHLENAPILQFLGYSLLHSGNFRDAIRCLKQSIRLKRENKKADPLDMSNNLNDLGKAYEKLNDVHKALSCYEEAFKLRKLAKGTNTWDIALTLRDKGHLHLAKNEKDKALSTFQDTIRMMENLLGLKDRNSDTTLVENDFDREARLSELNECYDDTLSLLKSDFFDRQVDIASILLMKGNFHAKENSFKKAGSCYSEVIDIYKEYFPGDHLSIANVYHNHATIFCNTGDYERAKELYMKSLKITKIKLGERNLDVADTLFSLGNVYRNLFDYKNALKHLENSLDIRQQLLGNDNILVSNTKHSLCLVLSKRGKHEKAIQLTQDTLLIKRSKLGIDHLSTISTVQLLGTIHTNRGEYSKALTCFQEALRVKRFKFGLEHIHVAEILFQIGTNHEKQGNLKTALHIYKDARNIFEFNILLKYKGTNLKIDQKLIQKDADGKEIINDLKKSLALHEIEYENTNTSNIFKAIFDLGIIYNKLDFFYSSIMCFQATLNFYNKHLKGDKMSIASTYHHLGCSHSRLRQLDKALIYFHDCLQIRQLQLGPNHEDVEETLHELGNVHAELGEDDKALVYYEKAAMAKTNRKELRGLLQYDIVEQFRLGMIHKEKSQNFDALQKFEEVLRVQKLNLPENHTDIANTLRHLGDVLRELGRYDKSLSRIKGSLRIYRNNGRDSISVAHALSSLGILYCEQTNFGEAMKCYKKALNIFRKSNSQEFIHIGRTLNNMGIVLKEQGDTALALNFFNEALVVFKPKFGDLHEEVSYTFKYIGNAYMKRKEYNESLHYLEKAILGEESRRGKNCLTSLGMLQDMRIALEGKGDFDQALQCLEKILSIQKSNFGGYHKDIAETLFKIGTILSLQGNHVESLAHYNGSLAILERVFKYHEMNEYEREVMIKCFDHLIEELKYNSTDMRGRIAEILFKKGNALANWKKNDDALQVYYEALEIQKSVLEEIDMKNANAFNNIANILTEVGQMKKAIKYYAKAVEITKILLGDEHFLVSDTFHNIGLAYDKLDKSNHAVNSYKIALKIRRDSYGNDHEIVAATLFGLGIALNKCKLFSEAANNFTDCLRIRRRKLGPNNLVVATTLFNLGKSCKNLSEDSRALNYFEETLMIQRRLLCGDDMRVADTLMALGEVHNHRDDYDKAMICYNSALTAYNNKDESVPKLFSSIAEALFHVGDILQKQNKNEDAKLHFMDALQIRQEKLGEGHVDCAETLCNLGTVHYSLGDSDEAMNSYESAMTIYQRDAKKNDLNVAKVRHLKGILFFNEGKYEDAMSFFNEALQSRVSRLGQDHDDVADTLYYMGNIFNKWQDEEKAFKCFDAAQTIHRKIKGLNSLFVSNSLFHMGGIHESNDRIEKAVKCYTGSLIGRRQRLGDNAVEVAQVLIRMGYLHKFKSENKKAIICFQECLRIRRLHFVEDNSIEVAQLLYNMGAVFATQQQFKQAKNCYHEALTVYRKKEESNKMNVAKVLSLLAGTHLELEDVETAIRCYDESIDLYRAHIQTDQILVSKGDGVVKIDDDHIDYADALYNVGFIHFKKDNYDTAISHYQESLRIYRAPHGNDDLTVAKTMHSLALVYSKQKKYDKAMVYFEEVLRIRSLYKEQSKNEVEYADTLLGIALVHEKQREYLEALYNLEECLQIRLSHYGQKSMYVAEVLSNMGIIQGNLRDFKTALKRWEEALVIYEYLRVSTDDSSVVNLRKNIEKVKKLLKK